MARIGRNFSARSHGKNDVSHFLPTSGVLSVNIEPNGIRHSLKSWDEAGRGPKNRSL